MTTKPPMIVRAGRSPRPMILTCECCKAVIEVEHMACRVLGLSAEWDCPCCRYSNRINSDMFFKTDEELICQEV